MPICVRCCNELPFRQRGTKKPKAYRLITSRPRDLRASFRYISGGLIILGAVSTLYVSVDLLVQDAVWNLAGSVFAFLFGDRMYIKFGKR